MQPTHIFHADWGVAANKRWLARGTLGSDDRYTVYAPTRIENHGDLIPSIRRNIQQQGCAIAGFDFPIGVPERYAIAARIKEFKPFLLQLGTGEWVDFYEVARVPSEISIHRPFYPFKPGGTRHEHLSSAFGLNSTGDLRRKCERKREGRRAACPLFWTLGASQVGKGAIIGWRDVLTPAIQDGKGVLLWPFDGRLDDLLQPGKIVIAETYPAECYGWFLLEPLKGKGNQEVRRRASGPLLKWAQSVGLEFEAGLAHKIREGFLEGDDAFDAVVGLFGMIEVLTGRRQPGEPSEDRIRKLEGWILGQSVK